MFYLLVRYLSSFPKWSQGILCPKPQHLRLVCPPVRTRFLVVIKRPNLIPVRLAWGDTGIPSPHCSGTLATSVEMARLSVCERDSVQDQIKNTWLCATTVVRMKKGSAILCDQVDGQCVQRANITFTAPPGGYRFGSTGGDHVRATWENISACKVVMRSPQPTFLPMSSATQSAAPPNEENTEDNHTGSSADKNDGGQSELEYISAFDGEMALYLPRLAGFLLQFARWSIVGAGSVGL